MSKAINLKINPSLPLPKWPSMEEQRQVINGWRYRVTEIIKASKDLEVFDLDIRSASIDYQAPNEDSIRDFCSHVVAIAEADLKYPVILSPTGIIMDGRHRLIKAVLAGLTSIKAKRLDEWPEGEEVKGPKE